MAAVGVAVDAQETKSGEKFREVVVQEFSLSLRLIQLFGQR